MFVNNIATVLRTSKNYFIVPKRTWTQVGHVISIPPRVKCSNTVRNTLLILNYSHNLASLKFVRVTAQPAILNVLD